MPFEEFRRDTSAEVAAYKQHAAQMAKRRLEEQKRHEAYVIDKAEEKKQLNAMVRDVLTQLQQAAYPNTGWQRDIIVSRNHNGYGRSNVKWQIVRPCSAEIINGEVISGSVSDGTVYVEVEIERDIHDEPSKLICRIRLNNEEDWVDSATPDYDSLVAKLTELQRIRNAEIKKRDSI